VPEPAGQVRVPVQGSPGRVPVRVQERAVQEQAVQARAPERAVQEQAVQAQAPERAVQEQAVQARAPDRAAQVRGLEPVDQQKGWVEGPAMEPGMERSVASAPRRR
jgi:hypothetical protein